MRRFEFRLDRVLRLKRQRERQVELRQQQAAAQLHTARQTAENIRKLMGQQAASWDAHARQAMPVGAWVCRSLYLAQLERSLDAAEAHVRNAEGHLREVNAERAKIHAEVEALAHLREERWKEHEKEAKRVAQDRLDELSMRKWIAARAEESALRA